MSGVLVSVIMMTYNQERFIGEAIESVLMQETSFYYELIIANDCSTDNTGLIVNKYVSIYPNIVKGYNNSNNIGPHSNFLKAFKKSSGKYIALCEGDDYWINPYKLQKQITFLENNPEYGLIHGDVNHLYQSNGSVINAFNRSSSREIPSGKILEKLLLDSHLIKTMTTCFRKDIVIKYYVENKEIMSKPWRFIDLSLWLVIARNSKIFYLDEVLATYRLLPESQSRSSNAKKIHKFHEMLYNIRFYFSENYNVSKSIKTHIKASYHLMRFLDGFTLNNKSMMREAYSILISNYPEKISFKNKLINYLFPLSRYVYQFKKRNY